MLDELNHLSGEMFRNFYRFSAFLFRETQVWIKNKWNKLEGKMAPNIKKKIKNIRYLNSCNYFQQSLFQLSHHQFWIHAIKHIFKRSPPRNFFPLKIGNTLSKRIVPSDLSFSLSLFQTQRRKMELCFGSRHLERFNEPKRQRRREEKNRGREKREGCSLDCLFDGK